MNAITMPIHEGRNIKRIREILGVKQEALAIDLGLSQQAISLLEQKETLDVPTLEKVAKALKVPVEAIKNFDEDNAVTIISSTFNDHAIGYAGTYSPTFNPLDKVVELYERLLQSEKDKIVLLEKILEKKSN